MTFNVEIAEQALGAIKAFPEKHAQEVWRCETGMCFAGWVGQLTTQWVTNDWRHDGTDLYQSVIDPEGVPISASISSVYLSHYSPRVQELAKQGTRMTEVSTYAEKVLGVGGPTARVLFASRNTAEDLEHMIKALSNGGSIELLRVPDNTGYLETVGVRALDAEGNEVYSRLWY